MRVIARMTATFATSNVVRAGISFLTAIVIGRALGTSEFGRWTFCMTWASTLTVLSDLGFGVLLTRDAARSERGVGAAVGGAFLARIGVLVPIGLAMAAAAPWLGGTTGSSAGLRIAVLLAIAGASYGCLSAVFRAWPEWLVSILAIESAGALVQLAGSFWIVRHRSDVIALLWLATVVQAAQILAAMILWRIAADRHDRFERPSIRHAAALLRESLPFALSGVIANIQLRVAPLALGYLATTEQVALFGAAQRLGNLVRILPQSAFAGALPVLAREVMRGQPERVRSTFDRVVFAFAVVASAGMAMLAPLIIRLTYGGTFSASAPVLVWVAIALLPSLVNNARKVYLYAAGRERMATFWSGVALAVQACGCVLLVPTLGASGAAIALGVGEAAVWWPLQQPVKPIELAGGPIRVVSDSPLAS